MGRKNVVPNSNVFASVQTQILRMTTIWCLASPLGIPGREKRNEQRRKPGSVPAPHLFVHDNVGQALQHPMRGHGKDAGH